MFRLDGKVAAVTGAAKGMGAAIATTFAEAGAQVFLLDVDEEGIAETAAAITGAGGEATALPCNVADQVQVEAVYADIADRAGQLSLLVNNAGIAHIGTAVETSEDDFDRVFAVNGKGVYNCLKAGIPHLLAAGGGAILNMGSAASIRGVPAPCGPASLRSAVSRALRPGRPELRGGPPPQGPLHMMPESQLFEVAGPAQVILGRSCCAFHHYWDMFSEGALEIEF